MALFLCEPQGEHGIGKGQALVLHRYNIAFDECPFDCHDIRRGVQFVFFNSRLCGELLFTSDNGS